MRDFDDSTLWRISAYERFRAESGDSGFARLEGSTVLPSTLTAELSTLRQQQRGGDAVEVAAACMRQRESALLLLRHRGLVWPVTLFPQQQLYHLPRPIIASLGEGGRDLEVIAVEPPGLRPPGHAVHERIGGATSYRPLPALLWALAMQAPRVRLLDDIAGRAAYRVSADFAVDGLELAGALQPVLRRLRLEIASLDDIAGWPGMGPERAARVLNGVYLSGGLVVLRTHAAARGGRSDGWAWTGWLSGRRRPDR